MSSWKQSAKRIVRPTLSETTRQLHARLRRYLKEDLAEAGDVTSQAMIPPKQQAVAHVGARSDGIVSGILVVRHLLAVAAPRVRCRVHVQDGHPCRAGQRVLTLRGSLRDMLKIERIMLNLLGRMSGVATATAALVKQTHGTRARIRDTRKTTPGLRALEKYAVVCGGGVSHRHGLHDAFLAKDNHLAGITPTRLAAQISAAVSRARRCSTLAFTMAEVDSETQFRALLTLPKGTLDSVLLDNMKPPLMKRLVRLRNQQAPFLQLEASGGVTLRTVRAIARTGVDFISVGSITHSAPQLDFGLDMQRVKVSRP